MTSCEADDIVRRRSQVEAQHGSRCLRRARWYQAPRATSRAPRDAHRSTLSGHDRPTPFPKRSRVTLRGSASIASCARTLAGPSLDARSTIACSLLTTRPISLQRRGTKGTRKDSNSSHSGQAAAGEGYFQDSMAIFRWPSPPALSPSSTGPEPGRPFRVDAKQGSFRAEVRKKERESGRRLEGAQQVERSQTAQALCRERAVRSRNARAS